MYQYYSHHEIYSDTDLSFDADAYSLFKFGSNDIARQFGYELAKGFITAFKQQILDAPELVIVPSPYMAIPTASNAMTRHMSRYINRFLYQHGRPSMREAKITRNKTYTEDYGSLDAEQRKRLISSDTYYIDVHSIQDKLCIFVDDIKITGSHEFIIKRMIDDMNIQGQFIFCYYAELLNPAIAASFENVLNYHKIKTIFDLPALMNAEDFACNTRLVKYLLTSPSTPFEAILPLVKHDIWYQMLHYAISNDYHLIAAYQHNLDVLANYVEAELYKPTIPPGHLVE